MLQIAGIKVITHKNNNMENLKEPDSTEDLESRIKKLIAEKGKNQCISPDGKLKNDFILSCITENNSQAAQDYERIIAAYDKLKQNDAFANRVSKETLNKINLYGEYIVRPLKVKGHQSQNIQIGEIIKVPALKSKWDFADGEGWKASLLNNEERFKIGDKVLYSFCEIIILDNEKLHLVCSFSGKLID